MKRCMAALAASVLMLSVATASAATLNISAFGDAGWRSDDTRASGGTNLIGTAYTNAPASAPVAGHDAQIAAKLVFDAAAPAGFNGTGALKFVKTGNWDKATMSVLNTTTGFAASSGDTSWASGLNGSYRYYTKSTAEGPQLKIGIQSTAWASSQASYVPSRSGEPSWDYILVQALNTPTANAWTTVNVDATTKWRLFRQAGNASLPNAGGYGQTGTPNQYGRTLAEWAADSTFTSLLFGNGAKATNIQFGVGSSDQASESWLDSFNLNIYNGGDTVDMCAVPEPSTVALLLTAVPGAAIYLHRRRQRRS